jgi:hypothetical protein
VLFDGSEDNVVLGRDGDPSKGVSGLPSGGDVPAQIRGDREIP